MVFKFLKKAYAAVVAPVANILTAGIEKITGGTYGRTSVQEILEDPVGKVLSTAAGVTTLALGAVTLPYTAPVVAKAAVTFVAKAPVAALALGGLATVPAGRELIGQAAKGIFEGGKALGKAAEVAKEEGVPLTLKEGLKAAGLVGAGVVAAVAVPKIIEKIKGLPEKIPSLIEPEEVMIKEKPIGIEGEVPITPEVTEITVGKKPYKRRRAKIIPSVRQLVRVSVISRATGTGIKQSI
ncbi:unnamed protein product [marine sediment metagenome]|uniref:Uncharacterized protein n=1 Tax=marine sediment metagenome TaxID=412755 RepID=X1LYK6_9ZZZZ